MGPIGEKEERMHRKGLWVVTLALAALPLAAEPRPEPACGGAATELPDSRLLAAEQRLFDELSVLDAGSIPAPAPATYLEECWMCTEETPCDTECGWEPGKGGPVTCGEYGICRGWP